jgi:hypothetical protein
MLVIDGKNNNNDDKQEDKEDQQTGRQGRTTTIERQDQSVDPTPFQSFDYRDFRYQELGMSRTLTTGVPKSRNPKSQNAKSRNVKDSIPEVRIPRVGDVVRFQLMMSIRVHLMSTQEGKLRSAT